jgi:hypothetical protein
MFSSGPGAASGRILEFTYVICTYELHATICRALRLEYDDVDERVVEISAPEASGSQGRDGARSRYSPYTSVVYLTKKPRTRRTR